MTKDRRLRGICHPNSRLTEFEVLRIRDLYANGDPGNKDKSKRFCYTQKYLGQMFGVTENNISRIITRYTWKHI